MLDPVTPCALIRDGDKWRCETCGRTVTARSEKPPAAVCRGPRGLGDMVADGLASVGITKERVQAVASAVGIEDCGCEERQAILNRIGSEFLGMPEGRDVETTPPAAAG